MTRRGAERHTVPDDRRGDLVQSGGLGVFTAGDGHAGTGKGSRVVYWLRSGVPGVHGQGLFE